MHIAILADPIDNKRAGIYVYTKNLIEQLLKLDEKNKYSLIHQKPWYKTTFALEEKNILPQNTKDFVIPRKKIPGYGSYRKFFLIPKLIKKLQPDIVFEPCHIGPFRLPKKIKRVVMIHDLTPILFPQFHIKRSTIVHKLLLKRILKNANLILTASETTKRDILNYCETKTKIEVIPLGIKKRQDRKSEEKPQFPYFLYLGTIEPRKNLETLISAFMELKKEQNIPHKLVLAGEIGWKVDKILKKIDTHNIILTNYLSEEEKADWYKNAEIFIYPSIYEGFGLPPLEAMSHKIPVICSTGGRLKEIFKNHALLFDPQDKKKLKKHIMELLSNTKLREKQKHKGLKFSKNFSWKKTAEKTLKVFKQT